MSNKLVKSQELKNTTVTLWERVKNNFIHKINENYIQGKTVLKDAFVSELDVESILNPTISLYKMNNNSYTTCSRTKAGAGVTVSDIVVGIHEMIEVGEVIRNIKVGVVNSTSSILEEFVKENYYATVVPNPTVNGSKKYNIGADRVIVIPINKSWEHEVIFLFSIPGMIWGGRQDNNVSDSANGGHDGVPSVGQTISYITSNSYVGQIIINKTIKETQLSKLGEDKFVSDVTYSSNNNTLSVTKNGTIQNIVLNTDSSSSEDVSNRIDEVNNRVTDIDNKINTANSNISSNVSEINTLKNSINTINTNINNINWTKLENINTRAINYFDKNRVVEGQYYNTTGNLVRDSNFSCYITDFKLKPNTTYRISKRSSTAENRTIVLLNKNSTIVGSPINATQLTINSRIVYEFTTPSNLGDAVKFVFNMDKTYVTSYDNVMVYEGTGNPINPVPEYNPGYKYSESARTTGLYFDPTGTNLNSTILQEAVKEIARRVTLSNTARYRRGETRTFAYDISNPVSTLSDNLDISNTNSLGTTVELEDHIWLKCEGQTITLDSVDITLPQSTEGNYIFMCVGEHI